MAGIKVTVKTSGLKELEASFAELTKATGRNVLKKALIKGAEILQEEAMIHAPVKTGGLRANIIISPKSKYTNMKGIIAGHIKQGMTRSNAVAAAKAKYGDEKSFAMMFMGVATRATQKGIPQEFGTYKMPAHPFMRPAWDNKQDAAFAAIVVGIKEPLFKAVARARKKKAKL